MDIDNPKKQLYHDFEHIVFFWSSKSLSSEVIQVSFDSSFISLVCKNRSESVKVVNRSRFVPITVIHCIRAAAG